MFGTTPPSLPPSPAPRRRILDNPRVLTALALLLVAVMAGLFWLSNHTAEIEPQFVNDVLLTALFSVNLALIVALVFVLARNLFKLWQERAAPFARFRTRLVGALLVMTIIPAVLVLISGSEIMRTSVAQWFTRPGEQVVTGALTIANRFYREQQESMARHAIHLADCLPAGAVAKSDEVAVSPLVNLELETMRDSVIEVYRVIPGTAGGRDVEYVTGSESPSLPGDNVRAAADRLALKTVESGKNQDATEDLVASGGVMFRATAPITGVDRSVVGVVVVSRHLDSNLVQDARVAQSAYKQFKELYVFQGPVLGSYLSIFVAATLLILISSTWLGLYLAKRITRPVQQLAEGARAIGAGHLDVRLEAETGDELGSLVDAFNMMAAELQTNRSKLDQSRIELERKNAEVDGRRRYIETVLERVATGVISLDAAGNISTMNGTAVRLLGVDASSIGRPAREVLDREDLRPLRPLVEAIENRTERGIVQEVTLVRDGREINLATAATVLAGVEGSEGAVLVLDDVTPLIRAQRVAERTGGGVCINALLLQTLHLCSRQRRFGSVLRVRGKARQRQACGTRQASTVNTVNSLHVGQAQNRSCESYATTLGVATRQLKE